jgi:hypothetical protein
MKVLLLPGNEEVRFFQQHGVCCSSRTVFSTMQQQMV